MWISSQGIRYDQRLQTMWISSNTTGYSFITYKVKTSQGLISLYQMWISSKTEKKFEESQSEHEGVRYYCKQCDYKAKQLGILTTHVNSKH